MGLSEPPTHESQANLRAAWADMRKACRARRFKFGANTGARGHDREAFAAKLRDLMAAHGIDRVIAVRRRDPGEAAHDSDEVKLARQWARSILRDMGITPAIPD